MASITEKIQNLISKNKKAKSHEVKFYAEARLEDGRVIATEEEALAVGVAIKVIEDDGVAYPLEAGSYKLEDGTPFTIDDLGIIATMGDEVAEAEEVEAEEENMAEDKETEMAKKMYDKFEEVPSEEMAKKMIDFIKEEMGYHDKEEMSEETEEEVVDTTEEEEAIAEENAQSVEMSSIVGDLITRIESLEVKLNAMDEEPAVEGVKIDPIGQGKELFTKQSRKDVLKMTTAERAKFMITNKITRI